MPGSFKHIINFLPLVRTFRASPTFVGVLPLIAVTGNEWKQARIMLGIGVNTPPVRGRRARRITGNDAFFNERTTIFTAATRIIIAIIFHLQTHFTNWNTSFRKSKVILKRGITEIPFIQINQRNNITLIKELVYGHSIMSRIKQNFAPRPFRIAIAKLLGS